MGSKKALSLIQPDSDLKLQLINSLGSGFSRGDYFLFGLVFTYKNNQIKILKNTKKKIKISSNRMVLVPFG